MRYKWMLFITIMLFTVGCQQQPKEESLQGKETPNQFEQVKNSSPQEMQTLTNEELATHLANIASDVPNVNSATAIIAGPYAVVGIDVDKHLDRSRVGTIKYSVSEALEHDPYGKTAVVVADADIMERIRLMGIKVKDGHPVQGIIDELSSIVGRYMPQFPVNEDKPKEPDQNKEIISDEEKQQLEEIEQDQSNDKMN